MLKPILELYPGHGIEHELKGLYLQHDLRGQIHPSGSLVCANFITSLDGRIAIPRPDGVLTVPDAIRNPRDWRLFQELAIQSDIILSSGRYLREYSGDRTQEILRVYEDPALADLEDWRTERGLERYPAIAIISNSLDFPVPSALLEKGRKVIILTSELAPGDRKQELMDSGLELMIAGEERVNGRRAVGSLLELGFKLVYSAAGPRVLNLLLKGKVLDRLYLTTAFRVLGGDPFSSILEGSYLDPPAELTLKQLFLDPGAPGLGGQLFATFGLD